MQSHSLHAQDTFLPIPGLISCAGLVLAETCSVQWVTLRAWHLGLFLRRLHSRIMSSRTHESMLANRWTMFVWTCCTLVIWHCKNSCKTQVHVHMHQPGQLTWKSFYLTGWNAWCWLVGSHTLYYVMGLVLGLGLRPCSSYSQHNTACTRTSIYMVCIFLGFYNINNSLQEQIPKD